MHPTARSLPFALALLVAGGCDPATAGPGEIEGPAAARAPFALGSDGPAIVEVTSSGMSFDLPASIPSGWTTFRYHNRTGVTHFFIIEKMPAGKTVEDSRAEVVPVFQEGMDLIIEGKFDEALAAFGALPAWYPEVVITGGPGLTAPGATSEMTVHLEPGTYVIECYVKAPDGTFHTTYGMIEGLEVTGPASDATPPEPTLRVTMQNDRLDLEGPLRPGRHTIAVHFAEQTVHEHFLGHDVHLVRLEDDTDMQALNDWMNWAAPAGLTTVAPAEFLGGVQEMPAGRTGYFHTILRPGRYALIAEVPDPAGKNMLHVFRVP